MEKIGFLFSAVLISILFSCSPSKEKLTQLGYQIFPEVQIGVLTPCGLIRDTITSKKWSEPNIRVFGCPINDKSTIKRSRFFPTYMFTIIPLNADEIKDEKELEAEWLGGYRQYLSENGYSFQETTFESFQALKVNWKKKAKELVFAKDGYICKAMVMSKDSLDYFFEDYISKIKKYR